MGDWYLDLDFVNSAALCDYGYGKVILKERLDEGNPPDSFQVVASGDVNTYTATGQSACGLGRSRQQAGCNCPTDRQ